MNGTDRYIIHVGDVSLDLSTPVVMSIINVTPDSFWDGSRLATDDDIRAAADKAVEDGAAILDVGGYSSRPGAGDPDVETEFGRVARAMEIIRKRHPDIPVSIDTFRSEVARRTIENYGKCIVNDISAGDLDAKMIPVVAAMGVPYIAMHMRATPADMQRHTAYDDIAAEVKSFFEAKTALLERLGVSEIIMDPGFGFAKTTTQNYRLMDHMDDLRALGYPVLAGISRKSMIYQILRTTPAQTLAGTCALNWESLRKGASILRVHDTKEAADIIRIYNYYRQSI